MSVVDASRRIRHRGLEQFRREQHLELTIDVVPSRYFQWKSVPDRIAAAILLIPGLPIIGLLIIAVRLTSRGPGIYRQLRTGKNGRSFTMLKIRTMVADAEARTGAVWAQRNDPRVTWLGKILRKLHLDEFPQLFNVLRGEMAFVGPRPERPEFVKVLTDAVPGYENRLAVLPGITGLAQINLPPDSDLESVRRKLALDLAYIEEARVWLDLRMVFCTLGRVVGIPGVFVTLLFGLRRHVLETHHQECVNSEVGHGQAPSEPLTPSKLSQAPHITVSKVSMTQAITARLASIKAVRINGSEPLNDDSNGDRRDSDAPSEFTRRRERFADATVSAAPNKPR